MNKEDSDTRWCEEFGEEVEVSGSLGDIEVGEGHVDASSWDGNAL